MDSVSQTEGPTSIADVLPDMSQAGAAPVPIDYNLGKQEVSTTPLQATQDTLQQFNQAETPDLDPASMDAIGKQMQQLANPNAGSVATDLLKDDPARLESIGNLMSSLASDDPVPVRTPKEPHPVAYEQSASDARGTSPSGGVAPGAPAPSWRSGWNVPHREKLQYLAPANPFNKNITDLKEPVLAGLYDLRQLALKNGYEVVIESGKDGKHADNSYHYKGEAIDVNFKKDGRNATYDKKALELFKTWSRQAGFSTLYDEAHHYDPKTGEMGSEKPGAHYHLAWGADAVGALGSYQLGAGRKPGSTATPIPHAGQNSTTFADVQPLLEAHDYKTMPGKAARAADSAGIDPRIYARLIQAESGFDHSQVSPAGAAGAAQLMPETAAWLAKKYNIPLKQVLEDPYTNMKVGARYLGELVGKFDGNYAKGLAAYNMGPGALQSYLNGKGNLPTETRNYVYKIMKDLYPEQFQNPNAVDYALKNSIGPKIGDKKTNQQIHAEELRAVVTPGQRVINGLLNLVPYGMRPGDGLIYDNVPEDKKAARNKTLGSKVTPDVVEDLLQARTGVVADLQNVTASFLNAVIPFGLIPNWRKEDIHERDKLFGYLEDGSHGGFMEGLHKIGTGNLPWFFGSVIGFNKLLGAAGAVGKAASGLPYVGKLLSPLALAAEAETAVGGIPLATQYIRHLSTIGFKDSSKFFKATMALGSVLGMDGAGRHFSDWVRNDPDQLAQHGTRDLPTAVRDATFEGLRHMALGSIATLAAPLGLQMGLSTVLRSPETADALAKALADANPLKAGLKRATAGGIGGVLTSQALVNPLSQAMGSDFNMSPLEGLTAGALLSAAGAPVLRQVGTTLEKMGLNSTNPGIQAWKKSFDNQWSKLDDSYKNMFTKSVMSATEQVAKQQAERVKISKVLLYQEKVGQLGEKMQPAVEGMQSYHQQKVQEAQQLQAQAQQATQAAKQSFDSLPPEKQQMVEQYQKQQQVLDQRTQQRDAIGQQMSAAQQSGNMDALKSAKMMLQPLEKEVANLTKAQAQIVKDHPEVPRVIQLGKKAQLVSDTVSKQLPELQSHIQTVGVGVQKHTQIQQNLLKERARLQTIPDDAIVDPSFNLGANTELVNVQHLPGEFPDLPGLDREHQARVATETSRNAIRQLVDNYNNNGTGLAAFDHELMMQGRKHVRDSLAGYQGPQGHDMSLFNSVLEMEGKSLQKTSFLKKELFGEAPIATAKQTTVRKMIKENNALRFKIEPKETYGYVNAEVVLDAAKKNGFDLADPTLQKMKSDLVNRGTGIGKDDHIVPAPMTVTGETFAMKRAGKGDATFQKFDLKNPELVSQALAAQAIGDTHLPVKIPKQYADDFTAFTNQHAEQMVGDVRDNYKSSSKNVRDYLETTHPQDIVKELPGFETDDGLGGRATLNETWYQKSLDKRLSKKFFEQVNGFRPSEEDIVEPLHNYMSELSKTPEGVKMINDMVSEEIRNVASIGMDVAGQGKQGAPIRVAKGDILPEQQSQYKVASNENGDFLVDDKGVVQFRKKNYVAGGVARQRLAMELPETKSSLGVKESVAELTGNDPMAFINNEQYHLKMMKDKVNEWSNGGKKVTSGDIVGHTQEAFGEQVYNFRLSLSQIGEDISNGLEMKNSSLYDDIKLSDKPLPAQFKMETIDALENGGDYASYIAKYGDIGKEIISNHLTVNKAFDDFKKSSEFSKNFARQSYFIHNYPELVAHVRASTSGEASGGISVSSRIDSLRRKIPTMKEARKLLQDTEKELEGKGIDRNKFLKMTPEKRAEVTNPDIAFDQITPEVRKQLIAEANQKSSFLLLRTDLDNMTPGKMIANRLKSMGHAESMRRFISYMMDSPTLDKEGNARYLVRVRDKADIPVVTFDTPTGTKPELRMDTGDFFSGSIDLKGKNTPLDQVYAHPEVMNFLNNYASSVENGAMGKAWIDFNRKTSSIRLLGSWFPFMSSTTTSLMSDITGNVLSMFSPATWNLSGAGKKIREGDRGRLMELYAYRNGLNAAHVADNTVSICNNIVESMDEGVRNDHFGVGNSESTRFYAAVDPNNPARKEAYDQLKPISKRAADVFSVPLEIEKATMRYMLYSHIRDSQLAAHYIRTNQMMVMEGGPLSNVSDPLKRLALASQGAAMMSNSNVGSMPYYLFNKQLRDVGQKTFLTPGWGMSVAHTVIDGMSGFLGLGNDRLRQLSPGTAEALDAMGRKFIGNKPLYANINPETRSYIRERMAKNIAGLVIASTAGTEAFNLLVNGETSYSDPDSSKWGKIRVGNTYFGIPLFGYVKKMTHFFNAGLASATKDDAEGFFNVFADELQSFLSPAFAEAAGAVGARFTGSAKMAAEEAAVASDSPLVSAGKRVLRAGMNTVGGQELAGFRQDADPVDVMAMGGAPNLGLKNDSSDAARLGGTQYISRVMSGVYDSSPNIPRQLRGSVEAREGAYRQQLTKQVENFFKGAMAAKNDPKKQQELIEKAKTLAITGIPIHDKVLKKIKDRETMNKDAFRAIYDRYMNPMKSAMKGADPVDRMLIQQKLEEYQDTTIDPYQSLIPTQQDGEEEE